jgi:hypothetical protein
MMEVYSPLNFHSRPIDQETCGIEYTSKLHRMFTDMSLSADLNLAFKSQEGGDMKGKSLLTNTVAYKSVIRPHKFL